jgi:hypothetical protein
MASSERATAGSTERPGRKSPVPRWPAADPHERGAEATLVAAPPNRKPSASTASRRRSGPRPRVHGAISVESAPSPVSGGFQCGGGAADTSVGTSQASPDASSARQGGTPGMVMGQSSATSQGGGAGMVSRGSVAAEGAWFTLFLIDPRLRESLGSMNGGPAAATERAAADAVPCTPIATARPQRGGETNIMSSMHNCGSCAGRRLRGEPRHRSTRVWRSRDRTDRGAGQAYSKSGIRSARSAGQPKIGVSWVGCLVLNGTID